MGGEAVDLLAAIALSFSMAGQVYTSQVYGAQHFDKLNTIVSTFISFSLQIAAVFLVITWFLSDGILHLLNCPEEAKFQARSYMRITALGLPAIFGYNAVCGVLRGLGESRKPLMFVCISAGLNIGFDYLLVAIIPLEAAGTAIATIVAQYGSFIAALICLFRRRKPLCLSLSFFPFSVDRQLLVMILKLGIPQVIRTILIRFSMLWVNSMINSYGMIPSTTAGIGNKLMKFLEVFMLGVDTASAAMIGQNLGAKKPDRAGKTTLATFFLTISCASLSTLLCFVCPQLIFSLFSHDSAVLALGTKYLHIMTVHFYLSAVTGAFQSLVNGSGNMKLAMVIGLLDGVICKIGLSLLAVYVFDSGYIGLFWAIACSRGLSAVVCLNYYISGKWRERAILG